LFTGKRVLVYRIGQLGDALFALPAFWAVRKHFSEAHLALLTDSHASKGYVSTRDLLPEGMVFDEVIFYEANLDGVDPRNVLKILPRLRQARFDTLVYLAPRLRTRWQVLRDLAFFRLAGISHFFGHRGFAPLPARIPGSPLPFAEHETDHLLSRLALSGIPVPPPEDRRVELHISGEELSVARGWLEALSGTDHMGRLMAVGPGSKWPSKVWPEGRYIELVRVLVNELGVYPVVFGGPELSALGDRLIAAWGCGANAAGRLSVRQAAAAMSYCKIFVGNDTGTMHLAAAMDTPCVGIFAAVGSPGKSYPYGRAHRVLRRAVPCEGCLLYECIEHDMKCLKLISVDEAAAACRAALAERGIKPAPAIRPVE
jgi:ADP-heptose:LPS heptosyltransferase